MSTLKIWESVKSDLPLVRLDDRVNTQSVTFTGTAGQSEAFGDDTSIISILADADCSVKVGDDPTATTDDFPVPAGERIDLRVNPGEKISAIANPGGVGGGSGGGGGGDASAANQATMIASLSVMDDWDESDRAKVNPIVGQAGVAGGSGAAGATTQRVIHASDDPAVTALQVIDDWDESDRAKVNLIVGQAGVAGGAGAVGATTQRVTLASDDPAVSRLPSALGAGGGLKVDPAPSDYETVAASQTDQMMGGTGAAGDRLDAVLIIPATTSPGEVSIEDGSTNTVIFTGGASSVSNLVPFLVPMGTQGIVSVNGGWEITTGANVRAIGFGQFSA